MEKALLEADCRLARTVLVPVGAADRRAMIAVQYARVISACERRVVHVAVDQEVAFDVGVAWMRLQPHGLRLDIVDDVGGVPETVANVVMESLAAGADEVLVVLGRMTNRPLPTRFLHDSTAVSIRRAVDAIPGAISVFLPVPLSG
jgi:hypothetical protein